MIKSTIGDTSNRSGEPQVSLTESLDLDIQSRLQIVPDGVLGICAEINRAFVPVHTLARGITIDPQNFVQTQSTCSACINED